MSDPNTAALARRLDRLERETSLWRLIALLLLAVGIMGQTGAARVMDVEKLVLRDPGGRERAVLHVTPAGPSLQFFNEQGRQRVSLEAGQTREPTGGLPATLSLMDWEGRKRITLSSGVRRLLGKEAGGEGLSLVGPAGATTLVLASAPDYTALTLADPQGNGRAAFAFMLGQPRLMFFDGAITNERAHLDSSGFSFSDEKGRLQAALGVGSMGPVMLLKDSSGRRLWSVP